MASPQPESQPPSERRRLCTVEAPCTTLAARVTEGSFSSRPGFAAGSMMHLKTGKITQSPIWFNAPKSANLPEVERKLYLNFCPFCGFNMRPRMEKFERELRANAKPSKPKPSKPSKPKPSKPKA